MLQQLWLRLDAMAFNICREVAEFMREQEGQGATARQMLKAIASRQLRSVLWAPSP